MQVGYWNLTGYYIGTKTEHPSGTLLTLVKMEPSQNAQQDVPDIIIVSSHPASNLA